MSGGQQARTSLARSVYAVRTGCGVVLLDDPLAAIDNKMVETCFEEAIEGAMASATRVVVVNSQVCSNVCPQLLFALNCLPVSTNTEPNS